MDMKIKKIFFLFLILTSFLLSQNKIASIHFLEGKSTIISSMNDNRSIKAIPGRNIYSGDLIKVNSNSSCFVRFIDNKTHIQLSANSIIKITKDENINKIDLVKGDIYIKNLYDENKRTYLFTENNQVYLSNHRIWVSTNGDYSDQMFSLDTEFKVYNLALKKSINAESRYLLGIDKFNYKYLENINTVVPDYVLSDIKEFNYNNEMEIVKYDLIPTYGDRVYETEFIDPYNLSADFGTKFLNSSTHLKLGLYPQYKKKNFFISMDIESYVNPSGNNINDDWDDMFDIMDKLQLFYSFNDDDKNMRIEIGKISNISFGSGYLLNDVSNTVDYPRIRYSGLSLDYIFDIDFMDFTLVVPSIRDFKNSGGVIGARTSLFISHNFPLTLGFGFVADLNQFSQISNYLNINTNRKRTVYGAEFDFSYSLISELDFQMNVFGEFVGLWYPAYTYYILSNDNDVSDDLRWRKGTWGINAPGISLKFDNRYSLNISFNYNSGIFMPNYFNSTYLYNRVRYFKANLEQVQFDNDFPIVQKQINSLNQNFLVKCDDGLDPECEYLIPKDVYPVLFSNDGFSANNTYGLSTEFMYNFHSYMDFSVNSSIFIEDKNTSKSYSTFQVNFNINKGLIRNLNNLKFYYSNIFFSKFSDKHRMNYGIESEVQLPMRLSLIINLGQVYYDSNNIIDNNIDRMSNSSINLKYNF